MNSTICTTMRQAGVFFFLNRRESKMTPEEAEIKQRDSGTPIIKWYNGHLACVIIQNPYG